MALNVGTLSALLDLDAKPFENKLNQVTRKGQQGVSDGLNKALRDVTFGLGLGFAGFKIEGVFKDTISEARQAQRETALTQQVIRTTGGVAGVSAKDVDRLATSLSKVVGVDDEVIAQSERVLLTFLKVRNETGKGNDIFNQATKAALDMSKALGIDLQDATIAVGKALNEPATGALALSRNGSLARSDLQKLQDMMKRGVPLIEQQRFILQKLGEQYAGAAEKGATAGDKLHVSIKNLEESVGTGLLPAIDALDEGVAGAADAFTALPRPIQSTVSILGTAAVAAVAGQLAFSKLATALEGTTLASVASGLGLGGLVGAMPAIAGGTAVAIGTFELLNHTLGDSHDKIHKAFENLEQAVAQSNGVLSQGAAGAITSYLKTINVLDKFTKAGITVAQVYRVLGEPNKQALKDLADMGHQAGLTGTQIQQLGGVLHAFQSGSISAKQAAEFMGDLASSTEDAAKAAQDLANAYNQAVDAAFSKHLDHLIDVMNTSHGVTTAEADLADTIKGLGSDTDTTTTKMKTYKEGLDEVFGSVLAVDRAHLAARSSLSKLTDTNKNYAGDAIARLHGLIRLDGQQAATQDDVKSSLLDVIDAREQEVEAMAQSGEIANTAAARHQALVDKLLDLRNQFPSLAGDIDRYIDAAKRVPELPLDTALDITKQKNYDLTGSVNAVIGALEAQAKADDDPIRGLETMDKLLEGLIQKYKDVPAAKDAFVKALNESVATEAQLLGIDPTLLAALLNPQTAANAVRALGFSVPDPPHRALGGPVAPGAPYLVGERGPELFIPSSTGSITPNNALGRGGFTIEHLEVHEATSAQRTARATSDELRALAYVLGY